MRDTAECTQPLPPPAVPAACHLCLDHHPKPTCLPWTQGSEELLGQNKAYR